MKRLALTCLTAGLLVAAAPGAALAAAGYVMSADGICSFRVANDTSDGAQFGGPDVWNGVVWMAYETPLQGTTLATATVSCEATVNGVNQGTVLPSKTGQGPIADIGQIQFTAQVTDVVALCDVVIMNSVTTRTCHPATVSPAPVNLSLCELAKSLAPTVNPLAAPTVYIDPLTGDIHVLTLWILDCPPYGS